MKKWPLLLLLSGVMFAQAPQTAPANNTLLSKDEQLELENITLKGTLLQQQEQALRQQYNVLATEINKAHPGFHLVGMQLQPDPPPVKAPEKTAPQQTIVQPKKK